MSILQGLSYLTMFSVLYSAERTKLVEVLDHFFRQRLVDSDDDDGDDTGLLGAQGPQQGCYVDNPLGTPYRESSLRHDLQR